MPTDLQYNNSGLQLKEPQDSDFFLRRNKEPQSEEIQISTQKEFKSLVPIATPGFKHSLSPS